MSSVCTICTCLHRDAIDRLLVMGSPNRRIAAQYGVTEQALRRHRAAHLPSVLVKAQEAHEMAHADNLLMQLQWLQWNALSILDAARQVGDARTALAAIREARGNLELLAKLLGGLE